VIVTFRKRRCFAKENVAGLGMRVNLKTQSRFLWRKVGTPYRVLTIRPTKIPSDRARTRYLEISKRCAGHLVYPVEQATPSLIQSNAEDGGPGRRQ